VHVQPIADRLQYVHGASLLVVTATVAGRPENAAPVTRALPTTRGESPRCPSDRRGQAVQQAYGTKGKPIFPVDMNIE